MTAGKVVVLVLLLLPVCDVGFHTSKKPVFHFSRRFVLRRNRDNIYRQFRACSPTQLTKLCHHTVFDICRISRRKISTPYLSPIRRSFFKLESIRTNIVLKIVTFSHTQKHIKAKPVCLLYGKNREKYGVFALCVKLHTL